jgi:hypothetical protein
MAKSIIPWHVFHGAIETLNPQSLNFWLERWRFMDGGVILFDANIPAFDVPQKIFNFIKETKIENCGAENGSGCSPHRVPSVNKNGPY